MSQEPSAENREALADKLEAAADRPAYRGMLAQSLMRQAASALRAQAPAPSDVVERSWHPEDHLPADPSARPPEGDIAGWCRFYAWGYGARPWGSCDGDYGGSCEEVHLVTAADEIDRLRAALPTIAEASEPTSESTTQNPQKTATNGCESASESTTPISIADARASALEEAAGVADALVYNPPTDGEMEAWNEAADHIAAAIRKLKDRG